MVGVKKCGVEWWRWNFKKVKLLDFEFIVIPENTLIFLFARYIYKYIINPGTFAICWYIVYVCTRTQPVHLLRRQFIETSNVTNRLQSNGTYAHTYTHERARALFLFKRAWKVLFTCFSFFLRILAMGFFVKGKKRGFGGGRNISFYPCSLTSFQVPCTTAKCTPSTPIRGRWR